MRVRRIEMETGVGHLVIERHHWSKTIRIASCNYKPGCGHEATWKSWKLAGNINTEELFKVAQQVQLHADGVEGTNSMVHEYYNEMLRLR